MDCKKRASKIRPHPKTHFVRTHKFVTNMLKTKDKNMETMFSRFKILAYKLKVYNKSYIIIDHVKKILKTAREMGTKFQLLNILWI